MKGLETIEESQMINLTGPSFISDKGQSPKYGSTTIDLAAVSEFNPSVSAYSNPAKIKIVSNLEKSKESRNPKDYQLSNIDTQNLPTMGQSTANI